MIGKTLEDILIFFYQNDIEINRKAIVSLIKCFKYNEDQMRKMHVSAIEYIVDNLFTEKERKMYYRTSNSTKYFMSVIPKRLI